MELLLLSNSLSQTKNYMKYLFLEYSINKIKSLVIVFFIIANLSYSQTNCRQQTLVIKTGFDFSANSLLPENNQDLNWVIVQDINNSTIEPRPVIRETQNALFSCPPGAVTFHPPSWGEINNWSCGSYTATCASVSAAPCAAWAGLGGPPPGLDYDLPIIANYSFCIAPGSSLNSISLNFGIAADDYAKVCLNGIFVGNSNSRSNFNFFAVNQTSFPNIFHTGVNVISVSFYNLGNGPVYFNFEGTLVSSIPNSNMFSTVYCCNNKSGICGFKFLDENANGVFDSGETKIPNWPIALKDLFGNIVSGTYTDVYGNYSFLSVAPGQYVVEELNQLGFYQTFPSTNFYSLNLIAGQFATNINFGNKIVNSCSTIENFSVINFSTDPCTKVEYTTSIVNPFGFPLSANFDFGDGSPNVNANIVSSYSNTHTYSVSGTYFLTMTVTGPGTCVTTSTQTINVTCPPAPCPTAIGAAYQTDICNPALVGGCEGKCKNISGTLQINTGNNANYSVSMNFGDGSQAQNYPGTITGVTFTHNYPAGTYTVTANISGPGHCFSTYTFVTNIICEPPPCSDCIGSFAPIPDSTYIISAWVKEANATVSTTNYTHAKIEVSFYTAITSQPGSTSVGTPVIASPSGLIIDGWQKIEQKFKIPAAAAALKIDLKTIGEDANFDDIRVFPYNGSIKSYVYDPKTMRLMAELDERNYATFYEYDEEGKLIRVKKETEKGIMTIKESRNSSPVK